MTDKAKLRELNIHILQHIDFEEPGSIIDWIISKNHKYETTNFKVDPTLPNMDDLDIIFVLGGPMSVHDVEKYPWLAEEKKFIKEAILRGKIVIGFCLGAQLIAEALGSTISQNDFREIGWHPIRFKRGASNHKLFKYLPDSFTVFHWHGESFNLPEDAKLIASSRACENQIFTHGENVLAMQCHLEQTEYSINNMLTHAGDTLHGDDFVQTAKQIIENMLYTESTNRLLSDILDRLEKIAIRYKKKRI